MEVLLWENHPIRQDNLNKVRHCIRRALLVQNRGPKQQEDQERPLQLHIQQMIEHQDHLKVANPIKKTNLAPTSKDFH